MTLYVGSSEKNVHLFYHVYSGNRMLVSDSFVLNEEIRSFDYTWRPEYGDGITVSFGFMKDGIWYSKQVALKRPVPEKKLTLKWEVFRDRLRPGTEETWTMQILDAAANRRMPVCWLPCMMLRSTVCGITRGIPGGFSRYTPSVMPFIQSVNSIAMLIRLSILIHCLLYILLTTGSCIAGCGFLLCVSIDLLSKRSDGTRGRNHDEGCGCSTRCHEADEL